MTYRDEQTVIVDEIYLITLQSRITSLQTVLSQLVEVIDAHELESLSCDRDGQEFCDCLESAVRQAKEALS